MGHTCGSPSSRGSLSQEASQHALLGSAPGPTCPPHPVPSPSLTTTSGRIQQYLNSCSNADYVGKCLKVPHCPGTRSEREAYCPPPPRRSRSGEGQSWALTPTPTPDLGFSFQYWPLHLGHARACFLIILLFRAERPFCKGQM